jgi:16S rRNA processing protein RimM
MGSLSKSAKAKSVALAEIVAVHGLRGWLKLRLLVPPDRLRDVTSVSLGDRPYLVEAFNHQAHPVLLKLVDVDSRSGAEALIGQLVLTAREKRDELPPGFYAVEDLCGFQVQTEEGKPLGTLSDVWNMPANDVWIVRTENGKDLWIPALKTVILLVDVPSRLIVVASWGVPE